MGFLAFFPILLIIYVLMMGIHKYGTSNRLLGYELHLQRTAHFMRNDHCHGIMRQVGWEEALRAWRVVQPTLWEQIYQPIGPIGKLFLPIAIKPQVRTYIADKIKEEDPYAGFWFDQKESYSRQKFKDIQYFAGGYLTNTIMIFIGAVSMCLVLPTIAMYQIWHGHTLAKANSLTWLLDAGCSLFYAAGVVVVILVYRNIISRVKILESGLGSIHSCAILWEAVVLAHVSALVQLSDSNGQLKSMHGYTKHMAECAHAISRHVSNIHKWIDETTRELDKKLQAQHRGPVR
jgi:hypothetical protein